MRIVLSQTEHDIINKVKNDDHVKIVSKDITKVIGVGRALVRKVGKLKIVDYTNKFIAGYKEEMAKQDKQ